MKKYFVFIMGLFLVMYMSPYSFASGLWGKIDLKGFRQDGKKKQNLELSGKVENGVRIIEVMASRYKFSPDPIVVKFGEKVRLVVTSQDVSHGLAITGFKVNVSIPAGRAASVEFVADKKGTFHIYCSVYCGPGHGHMHGKFIVQ